MRFRVFWSNRGAFPAAVGRPLAGQKCPSLEKRFVLPCTQGIGLDKLGGTTRYKATNIEGETKYWQERNHIQARED